MRVLIEYHKWRLRCHYFRWHRAGDYLGCGLSLAKELLPGAFTKAEKGCVKHARALRELGEDVPPVPGEKGFR